MSLKQKILSVYNWAHLSPDKTNLNQKRIRDIEWDAVKPFIISGKFLDVGCGAGYTMNQAMVYADCTVWGIDPDPGGHGVGRMGQDFGIDKSRISTGFAEDLPYESNFFDTLYSSHVLEHVMDEHKSLSEMNRVMKQDGVLIIGMPTATMATINLLTSYFFTSHQKLLNLLLGRFISVGKVRWWEIIIPPSHSFSNKTVIYDLRKYRVKNWKRLLENHFRVEEVLLPALYPYPEYRQWFPLHRNKKRSSSVFFICRKK